MDVFPCFRIDASARFMPAAIADGCGSAAAKSGWRSRRSLSLSGDLYCPTDPRDDHTGSDCELLGNSDSASKKSYLKCLMAPAGDVQDVRKFRLLTHFVEQGVTGEVRI